MLLSGHPVVNRFRTTETKRLYMYHLTENRKTQKSAELIYEALCKLLQGNTLSEITVQELVLEAKVGRATFYRLFDSIPDVLKYKCDKVFEEFITYINNYRKSELFASSVTSTKLLLPLLRFWYLDSLIIEVIIKSERVDILHNNIEKLFERLFDNMDKEINPDFQKDYFVAIRAGILFNILIKWVTNKKNIPPDKLAEIILKQISQVKVLDL